MHRQAARRLAASSVSWVATMIVMPCFEARSVSSAITSAPLRESRLPVGSSASTTLGEAESARAIATRCCSPPESWLGQMRGAVAEADLGEHRQRSLA